MARDLDRIFHKYLYGHWSVIFMNFYKLWYLFICYLNLLTHSSSFLNQAKVRWLICKNNTWIVIYILTMMINFWVFQEKRDEFVEWKLTKPCKSGKEALQCHVTSVIFKNTLIKYFINFEYKIYTFVLIYIINNPQM